MIHCKELTDKVVRLVTIYEDGTYGPEVHIEFTDGTTFSACLKTNVSIEAKYIHDQGGEPCILRDYSTPAILVERLHTGPRHEDDRAGDRGPAT
jgi:hypothetical protein